MWHRISSSCISTSKGSTRNSSDGWTAIYFVYNTFILLLSLLLLFTGPVVISFQCVRYCVQIEKRVWSFSRCVRFGVLSQKQMTTLALGLSSRGTSQLERLFYCFWTCVMKMPPFLLYQTVLHLMVVKSNLKITIL